MMILFGSAQVLAEGAKVLIICSDQQESTLRSVKGIRQTVETGRIPVELEVYIAISGDSAADAVRTKVTEFSPSVIVTVGSRSTRLAKSLDLKIPIVFSSVLSPVTSGLVASYEHPGEFLTGASLDIDVNIQLERFKRLVPKAKRIGVLYSERTAYMVEQSLVWASQHSLEMVPFEVKSPKDVPTGVDSLTRSCDGLWAIPDELIYTPQSTRFILLESFRNMIPTMGFSPSFVQSGALFALVVDHKFVGVQAGGLVTKILNGTPASKLSVTTPEAPYLYLNRNTAEKLRLDIPSDYYSVAKEVYE
ncbi:MAG: ABC transporter substrate-binding protein [candidate division Zixibacteria bacterium]|nr:ABC transporter substrate-binding protein [candidate division Zixibacteria bacterium]